MKTPGFIFLSRDILSKSVWDGDPQVLKLWIYVLLRANYGKPYLHNGVQVTKGHLCTSYRAIASDCAFTVQNKKYKWSPAKVERMLRLLVSDGRIHLTHFGNAGTLIEVKNWSEKQSGDSYRNKQKHIKNDHSAALWEVWLAELSPSPPHPVLTPTRSRLLNALHSEQLSANGMDPLVLFRQVLQAVKASPHHMSTRAYQMPESLFRSIERREQWTHRAKNIKADRVVTVNRDWSVDQ
jgi:hypothetical protein